MTKISLGLSSGRKTRMIIDGVTRLIVGNLIAILVARIQDGISIDVVVIFFVFAVAGIGPIYRANRSLIEFDGDEILYTQPLFKILCKWDDFIGLRVSSDGVALRFMNSRIFTLKAIAYTIKYLGLWNNTVPLSPYLTLESRLKVWDVIEQHVEDEQEKKILELLLTG